jgi:hypothetical protein
MRLWSVAKHLLLATALVAGLALAACEASDTGADGRGGGGGGQDTISGDRDATVPLADGFNGGGGDNGTCTPSCTGKQCGPDGCGGVCGTCTDGTCNDSGQCIGNDCPGSIATTCAGKQCGSDGCGGVCGTCPAGQTCNAEGLCETGGCQPMCAGRQCGPHGCGSNCGVCPAGQTCNTQWQCEAPQGQDCIDWFGCANACDPQSPALQQCFTECDNELSDSALVVKNAFMACQTNECGQCADSQCLNECISTNCATEYSECIASSARGSGDCNSYFVCRNNCPDPDTDPDGFEACDNACITQGSPQGIAAAYGVIFCVQAACSSAPNWSACVQAEVSDGGSCASQYDACFGTVEYCDPATGNCLTCSEFNQCLNGCGNNSECQQNCVSSSTEEALMQYDAVVQCLIDNCPNGDLARCNQQQYLGEGGVCNAAYVACFGGGGMGDPCDPADHPTDPNYCLSCSGIITCVNGCTTAECQGECVARADAEAMPIFETFITCLFTECPDGSAQCQQAAQQGACADELQACIGDTKSLKAAPVLVKPKAKATFVLRRSAPAKSLAAPLPAL